MRSKSRVRSIEIGGSVGIADVAIEVSLLDTISAKAARR
jgi:hypothetical protein